MNTYFNENLQELSMQVLKKEKAEAILETEA